MRIKITKDCSCEHDAHEMRNYPREGLSVQQFVEGEELEVEKKWANFYGTYYRCPTESLKSYADISVRNAEEIHEHAS